MSIKKAYICSDPHVSFSAYGRVGRDGQNFRTEDFKAAFSFVVDAALKDLPDFFFVLGDLFDSPHPANNIRRFVNREITRLLSAGIKVRILSGNHEFCKQHHALEAMMDLNLQRLVVVDEPSHELIHHPDNGFSPTLLLFFPHNLSVERNEISMKDAFVDFCNKNKKRIKETHAANGIVILLGHFGVFGAKMNDGHSNPDVRSVTISDLDNCGADYVFLGDYHVHQVLPTKKNKAFYCGSIERTNSKDTKADKGFMAFEPEGPLDPVYGRSRFVKYDGVRPFLEILGTPEEIHKIIGEGQIPNGAIVKITCHGQNAEINTFRSEREAFQKNMYEKIGVRYMDIDEVIDLDPEQQQKAEKLRLEVSSRKTIEASDIEGILCENVDAKVKEEEAKSWIKGEIANIVKTVNALKRGK